MAVRACRGKLPDFSAFRLEGWQVLEYARHKRKLRLERAEKAFAFTLVLRVKVSVAAMSRNF